MHDLGHVLGEPGLDLYRDGHRTRLKWHMGRRVRTDVPFTPSRAREAMALGASFEVDLNPHAGAGFAVLHDATLDRETDGQGAVLATAPDDLRRLKLRRPPARSPTRRWCCSTISPIWCAAARYIRTR
jgi:hypothetical protein